jgi:hypothetical protein
VLKSFPNSGSDYRNNPRNPEYSGHTLDPTFNEIPFSLLCNAFQLIMQGRVPYHMCWGISDLDDEVARHSRVLCKCRSWRGSDWPTVDTSFGITAPKKKKEKKGAEDA